MENVYGAKGQVRYFFEPVSFVKELEIVDSAMVQASVQSATVEEKSDVGCVTGGV
jgi:hypothetical protein